VGTERAATPLFLVRTSVTGSATVAIVGIHAEGGCERLLAAIEAAAAAAPAALGEGARGERAGVRVVDVG
jgi:hypothetical protein